MNSERKLLRMAILNRFISTSLKSGKGYLAYALGEIFLIFVGVSLSIWFSNWNEARRDRAAEIKILKELKSGLLHDEQEVLGGIDSRQNAIKACKHIIGMMDADIVYHDSLNGYFSTAYLTWGTEVRTSAYESLKSRGVNAITNDSLRMKIIDLYDIAYENIQGNEKLHHDLFFNFLVHFNAKRFNSSNPFESMRPLDFGALMHDADYRYYLKLLIFYNDFLLRSFEKSSGARARP